jgi:hypothetical protein
LSDAGRRSILRGEPCPRAALLSPGAAAAQRKPSDDSRFGPFGAATARAVQRSEVEETEVDFGGGLFDGIELESTSKPVYTSAFWEALQRVQPGPNALGNIVLSSTMQMDGLKAPGENNRGLRYVGARSNLGERGYFLESDTKRFDGAVPAYWLPYKKADVVYAERAWYEDSVCQYFLTTPLSGCRFVLTDTLVMHIASDVGGASERDSKVRTRVEEGLTGRHIHVRRFSFTDKERGYHSTTLDGRLNGKGLVFGMRTPQGSWIYKALRYTIGSGGGTWSILTPE